MSGTRMVTVDVTAEDIRIGRRHDPDRCPVRRAMRRAGIPVTVVLGTDYEVGDDFPAIPLPKNVATWILRLDNGVPVRPFTFRVGRPS